MEASNIDFVQCIHAHNVWIYLLNLWNIVRVNVSTLVGIYLLNLWNIVRVNVSTLVLRIYHFFRVHVPHFIIHLVYLIFISGMGYFLLRVYEPNVPHDLDLIFTSVSFTTLTGLSVLETETLSKAQLTTVVFLIVLGGELFISIIEIIFNWINTRPQFQNTANNGNNSNPSTSEPTNVNALEARHNSIMWLGLSVFSYQSLVCVVGFVMVLLYMSTKSSAKEILNNKNIHIVLFSMLITISSFNNCGFVPTNENMLIFNRHWLLLLFLIPLILLGNTIYPIFIWLWIRILRMCLNKDGLTYLTTNFRNLGYPHLFSRTHCQNLFVTVVLILIAQVVVFWAIESKLLLKHMEGMNMREKVAIILFQVVNARHAGGSVIDISAISPAVLVFFIITMYLPPYTTFWFIRNVVNNMGNTNEDGDERENNNENESWIKRLCFWSGRLTFSQISYIVILIVILCMVERRKIQEDPLNFNLLTITVEVIGAYANVGWSTGYDCNKQSKPNVQCRQSSTSLSSQFNSGGKWIIILVMLFGKLKNFSRNWGKSWTLY